MCADATEICINFMVVSDNPEKIAKAVQSLSNIATGLANGGS